MAGERSTSLIRLGTCLLCLFCCLRQAAAQYNVVQLHALSQSGAQVGTSIDLSVTEGVNLVEVDSLHFSHPGITWKLKTSDPLPFTSERQRRYGHFRVDVPKDVPPGRYEVRVGGRHGVSNPRAFLISSLEHHAPAASHDDRSPIALTLGKLAHGKTTAAEIDYYEFTLQREQPIRIELLAQQLDSRLIGQLKLYDADGKVLAASRGADDVDPEIVREVLGPGRYRLAVHDFTFRGGGDFHYQLLVGDSQLQCDLIGATSASTGQLPRHWTTRALPVMHQVDWRMNELDASVAAPPTVPFDPPTVPFETDRWFPSGRSESLFSFHADKGDRYAIDVISDRLGEPTDARLVVHRVEPQDSADAKLHQVLSVDDSQQITDGVLTLFSKDPVALFQSPESSEYRISVRDLDDGQMLRRRQRFRLRVAAPDPGFDLVAYRLYPDQNVALTQPLGSTLSRGGAEVIRVLVLRRDGWRGAVRVTAKGLPSGVTAREAIIAPNQTHTQLTLVAAETATDVIQPFQIVGRSESADGRSESGDLERVAVAATITWGKGGGRDYIRSRIATNLYVAVSQADRSPVTLTLGNPSADAAEIVEVKKGETLSLPITVVRREGGNTVCVVRARDVPPGITGSDVTVKADASEAEFQWKVSSKAVSGIYSLWLQAETKIKVRANPQKLERAQAYRKHLQTLLDNPAPLTLDAIKAAIIDADKLIEAAKASATPRDVTAFVPTSNVTIRVVDP